MIDIISKAKESVKPIYFSGYQWKWTQDHSVLRMVAYEGGFDMKHEEVIRLGEIIQDQRNSEAVNG
ncbi:MAG TPA: hypothetical protein PKA03_12130 [Tabrizicola sp.]|nr:hypothetical protein [Tabrizicola sp.]